MLQASQQQRMPTWAELIGDQVLSEFNLRFEVNFPTQVFDTVSEAQQFEKLGFRISPVLRMAILRKEQLFQDATAVSQMIERYNATVEGLSLAKVNRSKASSRKVLSLHFWGVPSSPSDPLPARALERSGDGHPIRTGTSHLADVQHPVLLPALRYGE